MGATNSRCYNLFIVARDKANFVKIIESIMPHDPGSMMVTLEENPLLPVDQKNKRRNERKERPRRPSRSESGGSISPHVTSTDLTEKRVKPFHRSVS